jgi:soluble lytic murein transglycosylase-like protein
MKKALHFIFGVLVFSHVTAFAYPFKSEIRQASKNHKIPPALLYAVIERESNFDANAIGSVGEIGLGQIRFGVWRDFLKLKNKKQLFNPRLNVDSTAKILSHLIQTSEGSIKKALRKYNGGDKYARDVFKSYLNSINKERQT